MKRTLIRNYWDVFNLIFIPVFTILLAGADDLLYSNLSMIAYNQNRQVAFLIWGVLSAIFFDAYFISLFIKVKYRRKLGFFLLEFSVLLLIFAVLTPYLPEKFPRKARMHELFAFTSPIFLLVSMICFQTFLEHVCKVIFKRGRYELIVMTISSFALLFSIGIVSSLLEIFVTLSVCYYLRITDIRICRMNCIKEVSKTGNLFQI